MFTGIVQCTGRVTAMAPGEQAQRLGIEPAGELANETRPPRVGDSISVSGVCLTVAASDQQRLDFDVVPETLRCTKLGDLQTGDRVNLEPAVAPNQPMGGHFMQGHVDALRTVRAMEQAGEETRLKIELDPEMLDYITAKGSIAIDGVSLTIAAAHEAEIEIALIPTTLEHTTLGDLDAGQKVNIETDMIARTVVQWLQRHGPGAGKGSEAVTRQMLDDAGFDRMG
jgi:riboflavin synthase